MSRKHRGCTARNADGRKCRNWAVRGTDPPLCSRHAGVKVSPGAPPGNQNARKHGFYSPKLEPDELADLLNFAHDFCLDDEIAVTRVALRRILSAVSAENPQRAHLVCMCASTVARLLREKRVLEGEAADGLLGAVEEMLADVGDLLDVDLVTRR